MSKSGQVIALLEKAKYTEAKAKIAELKLNSEEFCTVLCHLGKKFSLEDSDALSFFQELLSNSIIKRKDLEKLIESLIEKVDARKTGSAKRLVALDLIIKKLVETHGNDESRGENIPKEIFLWVCMSCQQSELQLEIINGLLQYLTDAHGILETLKDKHFLSYCVTEGDPITSYIPFMHYLVARKEIRLLELLLPLCSAPILRRYMATKAEAGKKGKWNLSTDTLLDYIMLQEDAVLPLLQKLQLAQLIISSHGSKYLEMKDAKEDLYDKDFRGCDKVKVGTGLDILTRCFENLVELDREDECIATRQQLLIQLLDLGVNCKYVNLYTAEYFPLHHLVDRAAKGEIISAEEISESLSDFKRRYNGKNIFDYAIAHKEFQIISSMLEIENFIVSDYQLSLVLFKLASIKSSDLSLAQKFARNTLIQAMIKYSEKRGIVLNFATYSPKTGLTLLHLLAINNDVDFFNLIKKYIPSEYWKDENRERLTPWQLALQQQSWDIEVRMPDDAVMLEDKFQLRKFCQLIGCQEESESAKNVVSRIMKRFANGKLIPIYDLRLDPWEFKNWFVTVIIPYLNCDDTNYLRMCHYGYQLIVVLEGYLQAQNFTVVENILEKVNLNAETIGYVIKFMSEQELAKAGDIKFVEFIALLLNKLELTASSDSKKAELPKLKLENFDLEFLAKLMESAEGRKFLQRILSYKNLDKDTKKIQSLWDICQDLLVNSILAETSFELGDAAKTEIKKPTQKFTPKEGEQTELLALYKKLAELLATKRPSFSSGQIKSLQSSEQGSTFFAAVTSSSLFTTPVDGKIEVDKGKVDGSPKHALDCHSALFYSSKKDTAERWRTHSAEVRLNPYSPVPTGSGDDGL